MGSGSDEDPFNSIPTMGPGLSSGEIDTTAMVTSCSSSRDESGEGGFSDSMIAAMATPSSTSPHESEEFFSTTSTMGSSSSSISVNTDDATDDLLDLGIWEVWRPLREPTNSSVKISSIRGREWASLSSILASTSPHELEEFFSTLSTMGSSSSSISVNNDDATDDLLDLGIWERPFREPANSSVKSSSVRWLEWPSSSSFSASTSPQESDEFFLTTSTIRSSSSSISVDNDDATDDPLDLGIWEAWRPLREPTNSSVKSSSVR